MQFAHESIRIIQQQFEGISILVLIVTMLTGILFLQAVFAIYSSRFIKKIEKYKKICSFILICYLCFVFQITFYNRDAGSRIGMLTSVKISVTDAQFIYDALNVVLFVPYGFIVSCLIKNRELWRKIAIVLCVSYLTSMGIEVCQLVTERGFFEIADLVMNTIGGFVGEIIAECVMFIIRYVRKLREGLYNEK